MLFKYKRAREEYKKATALKLTEFDLYLSKFATTTTHNPGRIDPIEMQEIISSTGIREVERKLINTRDELVARLEGMIEDIDTFISQNDVGVEDFDDIIFYFKEIKLELERLKI